MKRKCLNCGHSFETHTKMKYCCHECRDHHKNRLAFPDGSFYVECRLCGFRASDLNKHIVKHHNLTASQYCLQFGLELVELQSKELREHNSKMQKKAYAEGRLQGWGRGDNNPSKRKEVREGRMSIFSMNYHGYDGLSDEQKRQKIQDTLNSLAKQKAKNHNNPLSVDYYLKRGFTIEDAKQIITNRQRTFSLKKCIAKYGEIEGQKRFNAKQEKWQSTLNAKPQEEKDRINALKASSTKFICAYSKISQDLFNEIYNTIKDEFHEIYFATKSTEQGLNSNANFEYEVILEDGIHRFFLDFYVKDNNKVIEFDGDYWHGEARGNQMRDKIREDKLKKLGFTNILHIKECEYRINPKEVVAKCINFIRGQE